MEETFHIKVLYKAHYKYRQHWVCLKKKVINIFFLNEPSPGTRVTLTLLLTAATGDAALYNVKLFFLDYFK